VRAAAFSSRRIFPPSVKLATNSSNNSSFMDIPPVAFQFSSGNLFH
jgi:hypothetical protein